MSRAPRAPKTDAATAEAEPSTIPAAIAEGRQRAPIDRASAQAIADATLATGFPVPPEIQAILDEEPGSIVEPVTETAATTEPTATAAPTPEA